MTHCLGPLFGTALAGVVLMLFVFNLECGFIVILLCLLVAEVERIKREFKSNHAFHAFLFGIVRSRSHAGVEDGRKRGDFDGNVTVGRESSVADEVFLHAADEIVHVLRWHLVVGGKRDASQ